MFLLPHLLRGGEITGAAGQVTVIPFEVDGDVRDVAVLEDGGGVAGGAFTNVNQGYRPSLVIINSDGSVRSEFAPGISNSVHEVAQVKGAIFVGRTPPNDPPNAPHLLKIDLEGRIDSRFDAARIPGLGGITKIVAGLGGEIYALGSVPRLFNSGWERAPVGRLLESGAADGSFLPGSAPGSGEGFARQGDGKIIARFKPNSTTIRSLIRYDREGNIDESYYNRTDIRATITAPVLMVLQGDDKLIMSGGFNATNGWLANGLTRLNVDGRVDESFNASSLATGRVSALAVDVDDGIWVASTFLDGQPPRLSRLNADGSAPSAGVSMIPYTGTVNALEIMRDKGLAVGGRFSLINGISCRNMAMIKFEEGTSAKIGFVDREEEVDEGAGQMRIPVRRSGRLSSASKVDFVVQSGAGLAGKIQPQSGRVEFAANEPADQFIVLNLDLEDREVREQGSFSVTLSGSEGADLLAGRGRINVTIVENDSGLQAKIYSLAAPFSPIFHELAGVATNRQIAHLWGSAAPVGGGPEDFLCFWQGEIVPEKSGEHTFYSRSDDGARLVIGNNVLIDGLQGGFSPGEVLGKIMLEQGKGYDFMYWVVDSGGGPAGAILSWAQPGVAKEVVPGRVFRPKTVQVPAIELRLVSFSMSRVDWEAEVGVNHTYRRDFSSDLVTWRSFNVYAGVTNGVVRLSGGISTNSPAALFYRLVIP